MRKIEFPSVEDSDEEGLVAIGGDLKVDMILTAYKQGIFPWPISHDLPLAWFSPNPRGIIELTDWHTPKSFLKWKKKTLFQVTFNQSFEEVINQCASVVRKSQKSTWITPEIKQGYIQLFNENLAYSVEVWDEEKKLVGGLYGVQMGDFFSGESMFSLKTNASKLALFSILLKLKLKGIPFLDTQMVTPVVKSFGGKEIHRSDFLKRIQILSWE